MTELGLRRVASSLDYRCTPARYWSVLRAHTHWWTTDVSHRVYFHGAVDWRLLELLRGLWW